MEVDCLDRTLVETCHGLPVGDVGSFDSLLQFNDPSVLRSDRLILLLDTLLQRLSGRDHLVRVLQQRVVAADQVIVLVEVEIGRGPLVSGLADLPGSLKVIQQSIHRQLESKSTIAASVTEHVVHPCWAIRPLPGRYYQNPWRRAAWSPSHLLLLPPCPGRHPT